MRAQTILLHALLAARALADLHHLFVSSFTSPHIYSLEFNEEAQTLVQKGHTIAHDGHPWISFNYDKSSLYGGERDGFASYAIENSTSLEYRRSVNLEGKCDQKMAGFGSTYILPLLKAPFTVYGAPFGNCVNAINVDSDGTLQDVIQNITLESSSGIHGMAVDPENNIMFSADDSANGIWVHSIDNESTSQNLKLLSFVPAPEANAGPRHLVVHPTGKYLYVVMEAKNEIAVYAVNSGDGSDKVKIRFTGMRYSLIPKDANPSDYKADEILLSADNNILYASTRFRKTEESVLSKAVGGGPGYVTAVLLVPIAERQNPDADHTQGPGFPLRQLFQIQTTTSGGMSNAVSPAPWDRDYFAISDSEVGQVEIWKIVGARTDRTMYVGATGQDALTPAKGGWDKGMWVDNPPLAAPKYPGSSGAIPTQLPGPSQSGNPWQGSVPDGQWSPWQGTNSANPPGSGSNNPFQGGGGNPYQGGGGNPFQGGVPWGAGGSNGQPGGNPWSGGRGGQSGSGGDRGGRGDGPGDDDDRKGKVLKVRQDIPPRPATPTTPLPPQVTAKLIVTWKAPDGPGHEEVPPRKRLTLAERRLQARQATNGTIPAGGCCANAVWYH